MRLEQLRQLVGGLASRGHVRVVERGDVAEHFEAGKGESAPCVDTLLTALFATYTMPAERQQFDQWFNRSGAPSAPPADTVDPDAMVLF